MADQDHVEDDEGGWISPARGLIRVEMIKRNMSYADLSEALRMVGVEENERNLRNKVARGTFSAAFMLQCLVAMKVERIELQRDLFPTWRSRSGHWKNNH